jgi:hypothetical protein
LSPFPNAAGSSVLDETGSQQVSVNSGVRSQVV